MTIPKNWTFETPEIATTFDDHVRQQLPWYDLATSAVAHLVRHYLPKHGHVYDIGASTGNIARAISQTLQDRHATLTALETSPTMREQYAGPGHLLPEQAEHHVYQAFDVAVLFLTLQFIPQQHRQLLLERLKATCRQGGAIILVDKYNSAGTYANLALYRLTLAAKHQSGASPEDIIAKELSLTGVQRPLETGVTDGWLEFFRFGEFAGHIFEK